MVSDRLKTYRASAPADEEGRICLSLTHSAFSEDYHFTPFKGGFTGLIGGVSTDFEEYPVSPPRLPPKNTSGRYDMEVDLWNSGPAFVAELQAAAAVPDEQIEVTYRLYLDAGAEPEEELTFSVTSVALLDEAVTAQSSRGDILNKLFPSLRYGTDTFVGVSR